MRSRQKIMDATVAIVESDGFEAVSIAAVAHTAGVSRQTVYSIFGSREDMVSQAISAMAMEALGSIHAHLEATDTPFDYIVEFIIAGRAAIRAHPILATLLQAGNGNPLFDEGMAARAKPFVREFLTPLTTRYPSAASSLDELVDVCFRFGMSVILFDDETVHTDDALRHFMTRWLLPAMPSFD